MYRLVRPALFSMNPERAHEATLRTLGALTAAPGGETALWAATRRYRYRGVRNVRTVFGIRFPNPVGLAAGLDKDGRALSAWPALGFGFVEVGTVTRHPQPGNPRPRLYRLPSSAALINRMGFNNAGAAALALRLDRRTAYGTAHPLPVPLGISLGKSKITPLAEAVDDYVASLSTLYRYGDYFAVNVSSPNTPGLRTLQDRGQLADLLAALRDTARSLAGPGEAEPPPVKPLLVKVAPDLTDAALAELIEVCLDHGVAGLIATNTTLRRDGLDTADRTLADQPGGLSGAPLTARTFDVVRFVHRHAGDRLPVVGVGGIGAPNDALRLFDAGASLVQLYTGFVYRGPNLVRTINRALANTVGGIPT